MTPSGPENVPGHGAAIEYAQQHRDTVRRIISSRLGARLRRVFGTTDVEQSLLRILLAQPQPTRPLADNELARLVTVIVVRLVRAKARKEHHSRWAASPEGAVPEAEQTPDPAEQAAARDFMEAARRLVPDDWPLVEARLEGHTFQELTARFGSNSDALRMRFRRALGRIAEHLGGGADD